MKTALPERRLLVRAGHALVTLDLTQVREVRGYAASPDAILLAQALELGVVGPGVALLIIETQAQPVPVLVDAVGGVVEIQREDVLPVRENVLLKCPGLVRGVMRVPEPSQWRGASMLPTSAVEVALSHPTGKRALAVDLDPVELARVLRAFSASPVGVVQ